MKRKKPKINPQIPARVDRQMIDAVNATGKNGMTWNGLIGLLLGMYLRGDIKVKAEVTK